MENTAEAARYKGGEFIRISSGSTRDILTVLLESERMYTEAEVAALVEEYLNKEVKS
jgi:hypothetical protein